MSHFSSLFYSQHPGGKKILLEHAGKDSTEDFEDNEHSPDAIEMMQDYLIGELIEVRLKQANAYGFPGTMTRIY